MLLLARREVLQDPFLLCLLQSCSTSLLAFTLMLLVLSLSLFPPFAPPGRSLSLPPLPPAILQHLSPRLRSHALHPSHPSPAPFSLPPRPQAGSSGFGHVNASPGRPLPLPPLPTPVLQHLPPRLRSHALCPAARAALLSSSGVECPLCPRGKGRSGAGKGLWALEHHFACQRGEWVRPSSGCRHSHNFPFFNSFHAALTIDHAALAPSTHFSTLFFSTLLFSTPFVPLPFQVVAVTLGVYHVWQTYKGTPSGSPPRESAATEEFTWLLFPAMFVACKLAQARVIDRHVANLEIQDRTLLAEDPTVFWEA
ncbi:unnamed protein product [Closterium sp. NIES-53]